QHARILHAGPLTSRVTRRTKSDTARRRATGRTRGNRAFSARNGGCIAPSGPARRLGTKRTEDLVLPRLSYIAITHLLAVLSGLTIGFFVWRKGTGTVRLEAERLAAELARSEAQ